jgi:hypothetical protein
MRAILISIALAGLAVPVLADGPRLTLDDRCVVSALNRSVQVQADGSWVLPTIPLNMGRIRIRGSSSSTSAIPVQETTADVVAYAATDGPMKLFGQDPQGVAVTSFPPAQPVI